MKKKDDIKVLIVEDDMVLSQLLKKKLQKQGINCEITADINTVVDRLEREYFDLLILDLLLPKGNGAEVLIKLRRTGNEIPVLVLSTLVNPEKKVTLLESGADDYLEKPFVFEELLARIRANVRRRRKKENPFDRTGQTDLRSGDLRLSFKHRTLKVGNDKEEVLAPREFAILAFLMNHRGEICSRKQIWESIEPGIEMPNTNTIDVHLLRIRKRIGHDRIQCIKKRGFCFVE